MKLSIVVPCYNEEEVLPLFKAKLDEVAATLDGVTLELLLVDDGSQDGTLALSKAMAAQDSRVRYLSFSRNFGKEAAMLAGLSHATGDVVSVMDADLQDPPELLVQMLEIMKETGCDVVATRRVTRTGEPPIRSLFSRTFYKLINYISIVHIESGMRDFRLMRREVVDAILMLPEQRRFSKGLFAWVGFDVRTIAYENVERVAGVTKWSFWGLLRYALEGVFSLSSTPLMLPYALAVLLLVSTVILLLCGTWFAAILCTGTALILAGLGLIGQYLSRVYWEATKRPLYILRRDQGE